MKNTIISEYMSQLTLVNKAISIEPTLYIFCGIPGSGKTTLSKHLEYKRKCIRISTDEIKLLFIQHNQKYSIRDLFFIQYMLVEKFLKSNYSVIADSNSDKETYRQLLKSIAAKTNSNYKTIYCDVTLEVAISRMKLRKQIKHARKNFFVSEDRLKKYMFELEKPKNAVTINTNQASVEESCLLLESLLYSK